MIYHKSNFQEIDFCNNSNIITQKWLKKTAHMSDSQFIEEMSYIENAVLKNKSCSLLVNMSEFYFVVSPDLQRWVNKNVNKAIINNDIKKVAFVRSKDDIVAISVNQTITEDEGRGMNSKIFNSSGEAKKWLFK